MTEAKKNESGGNIFPPKSFITRKKVTLEEKEIFFGTVTFYFGKLKMTKLKPTG